MKMNRSKVLITMGILMLVASAVFEGYILYHDYQSRQNAEKIEAGMEQKLNGESDNNQKGILVEGKEYCGILEIPKIRVSLPVSSEYSYDQMSSSLCRYEGSLNENNMIICGHNNRSFLGKLSDVFEGDSIYFINHDGVKYDYVVNEVQLLGGYDVIKLKEGGTDWDLSVFTCNYSGSRRYVVRCKRQ